MIIYELFNVVKSAGIYEQNNSGKTCLIKCIKAIRDIILRRHNYLHKRYNTQKTQLSGAIYFSD